MKGPRSNTVLRDSSHQQTVNNHNSSGNSSALLIQNTLQNELITYENLSSTRSTDNYHSEEVNLFKNIYSTILLILFSNSINVECKLNSMENKNKNHKTYVESTNQMTKCNK